MAAEKKSKVEEKAEVVSPSDHPGVGESVPKAKEELAAKVSTASEAKVEEVKMEVLPPAPAKPKKVLQVVQNGAYWFGYNKAGELLMRSRSESTVRDAVKKFGG